MRLRTHDDHENAAKRRGMSRWFPLEFERRGGANGGTERNSSGES